MDTKEYFLFGRCSMCSGFFTGNAYYMDRVCDLIQDKFIEYLELGYGHADEQLYSPVYFENPDLFEHYYGDYNQMITNYKHIYENHIAPVRNFLNNSFQYGNYKKCLEACRYLLTSHNLKTCEYDCNGHTPYTLYVPYILYVHPFFFCLVTHFLVPRSLRSDLQLQRIHRFVDVIAFLHSFVSYNTFIPPLQA
jgi:hypothetical protein